MTCFLHIFLCENRSCGKRRQLVLLAANPWAIRVVGIPSATQPSAKLSSSPYVVGNQLPNNLHLPMWWMLQQLCNHLLSHLYSLQLLNHLPSHLHPPTWRGGSNCYATICPAIFIPLCGGALTAMQSSAPSSPSPYLVDASISMQPTFQSTRSYIIQLYGCIWCIHVEFHFKLLALGIT